jgi:TonB family protein
MCASTARRLRAFAVAARLAAALAATADGATAQTTPFAAPAVVPPVLRTDSPASYPEPAVRDHVRQTVTVTLILEVDPSGAVRKVTVSEPQGHGFDEAATQAAEKLVFTPAVRDGTPVAARIRFKYVFRPPPSKLVGRVVRQATDSPIEGAQVTARCLDGVDRSTMTAADGSWSLPGLAPGPIHLRVEAHGRKTQELDEDLNPAEEASVTLRMAPAAEPAPAAVPGAGAGAEVVEEVIVRGDRPPREVTKRTLASEEIDRIPGTSGDALRSIQNLPGVARPPPFSGLLVVRGSAPADTTTHVDGIEIPLVYHFGGLSSVLPTELLDKIDFYPGNYSAEYGRGMGGIVDIGVRDPKKDRSFHGMAQIDLIDARLMAEGPLPFGWTFLVAGRRSWIDTWLGPILEKTGSGVTSAPVYYDYQAVVQKDITPRSSFRLLFYGSDDRLDILVKSPTESDPGFGGGVSDRTSFWRLQAEYSNRLSETANFRVTAAVGQDSTALGIGDNYLHIDLVPVSGRAEVSQRIIQGVTAHAGVDVRVQSYDVAVRFPPIPQPGHPPAGPGLAQQALETRVSGTGSLPAMYTEWELAPFRGLRIVPGFRVDYSDDTRTWDYAPRISARQDLTSGFPRTTLKGGAGLFYQPPLPQETNLVFGQAGLRSNRSAHYDVGVEQEITRQAELSVDGFYKSLDRLVVQGAGNSGDGRAYGLEWLLRYKPDGRFFGWLAYTLSRSERRDGPGQPLRLFEFDQTHVLTLLGSYKLGRGWQVGGRFRLVSGNLYTPSRYGFFDANAGAYVATDDSPPFAARLPLFHQLDLRVDKTWDFKNWRLSMYLDLQNAYNYRAAEGTSYNYNYTQVSYADGLPILPSLGVRGDF